MIGTKKIAATLVTTVNSLQGTGGGVQLCTADYLWLLEHAGFELHTVAFEPDRRLLTRVLRKLEGRPFLRMLPRSLTGATVEAVEKSRASFVFFNLLDFPMLARALRQRFNGGLKLVHLSHGLDSTDICIEDQVHRQLAGAHEYDGSAARRLGAKLICEADYRRYLDACLCLSPLDAELERWLGAAQTMWFNRPIREARLSAKPVDLRVGCVSTLDHPPNYHGLVKLFEKLARRDPGSLAVRLVGGPAERGMYLERQFSFVEYLGKLSDTGLRREAETWSCFVHPVFHYARGCNTKLAVALGWGLPIATTTAGARGYVWDDRILPRAATPEQLVSLVERYARAGEFTRHRDQALQISALQPPPELLARQIATFLLSLSADQCKGPNVSNTEH